jgi:glycerol kinase
VGITRGTTKEHLIRATLESIGYQTRDVVECVSRDSGLQLGELRVDGGACKNDFLMQFQADLLGVPVRRPPVLEVTALGAAALAGIAVGYWSDRAQLADVTGKGATVFEPSMKTDRSAALYADWKRAVERSMGWEGE